MNHSILARHLPLLLVIALASFLGLAGCASQNSDDSVVQLSQTPGTLQPGQKVFNSPEEGAAALKMAFQTKDRHELKLLFGD